MDSKRVRFKSGLFVKPKLPKVKSPVQAVKNSSKLIEHKFKKLPIPLTYLVPSFFLGKKGKQITGTSLKVNNPIEFNNLFKKGDKFYIFILKQQMQKMLLV
jgi:hypothetical protein